MPKKIRQQNIYLDPQARADALLVASHFGLAGISAAVRFALRELARRIEAERAKE